MAFAAVNIISDDFRTERSCLRENFIKLGAAPIIYKDRVEPLFSQILGRVYNMESGQQHQKSPYPSLWF